MSENFKLDERRIMSVCASKFDGWRYREEADFEPDEVLAHFFETGEWSGDQTENLATFALLMRAFHWSLECEPPNSNYWRAARALFLKVYEYEIPAAYQNPAGCAAWEKEFAPLLAQCVRHVEGVHRSAKYDKAGVARRLFQSLPTG